MLDLTAPGHVHVRLRHGHSEAQTRAASAPAAFPAYGDSAGYLANPGYQCEDCHDPHGVGSNILMVKDFMSKATAQAAADTQKT